MQSTQCFVTIAGSTKNKETPKKVMFSDGIRPGGELTALDEPPVSKVQRSSHGPKRVGTPPGIGSKSLKFP